MSFSLNLKNKKRHAVSEINVTPLVDVLLVLLIIFMVAAPMINSGVDINLPQGSTNPLDTKNSPITISIKADGTIFLEEERVKFDFLPKKLLGISGQNLNNKIHIMADKNLDYGRVMEVVKIISLAGFTQVVLVTEAAQ